MPVEMIWHNIIIMLWLIYDILLQHAFFVEALFVQKDSWYRMQCSLALPLSLVSTCACHLCPWREEQTQRSNGALLRGCAQVWGEFRGRGHRGAFPYLYPLQYSPTPHPLVGNLSSHMALSGTQACLPSILETSTLIPLEEISTYSTASIRRYTYYVCVIQCDSLTYLPTGITYIHEKVRLKKGSCKSLLTFLADFLLTRKGRVWGWSRRPVKNIR